MPLLEPPDKPEDSKPVEAQEPVESKIEDAFDFGSPIEPPDKPVEDHVHNLDNRVQWIEFYKERLNYINKKEAEYQEHVKAGNNGTITTMTPAQMAVFIAHAKFDAEMMLRELRAAE